MTTIIIGLGNPGEKFKNTRHNVGFMAIDLFAEKNDFSDFKLQKKSNSLVSEGVITDEKACPERSRRVILVKPQTFMNDSGKTVREMLKNNPDSNLIVIHDDIDLTVGKIKLVKERGSAGHKGVESIIKNIGNKGLIRIRIGINPNHSYPPTRRSGAEKFVLQKFSKAEKKILNETIIKATEALDFLINQGLDKAMNEYNK